MRRKNRSANMKSELGQSVDHFKRAASLAAQETSATVGPKFNAARDRVQPTATKAKDAASSGWDSALATLAPLITAATENARQVSDRTAQTAEATKKSAKANKKSAKKLQKRTNKALGRKQKSSKRSKLGGLLLAGAAVGAAGAYVLNKRRRDQWDEYDPSPATSTTRTTGADDAAFEPADRSGPSGFVTPVDETAPVVGAAGTDPATGAKSVDPTVGAGKPEPTIELVDADTVDQTSSAQHSPKVARMAGGQNKS
jgi:hypothetical protein